MQLCKMQFCSKMLHVICISQAGESWKIWVPAAPTGAGGGNQGLKHTFHCRANEPLASVLLVATATLSSWVFQVRKMGFGDPGRPKNVTYNIHFPGWRKLENIGSGCSHRRRRWEPGFKTKLPLQGEPAPGERSSRRYGNFKFWGISGAEMHVRIALPLRFAKANTDVTNGSEGLRRSPIAMQSVTIPTSSCYQWFAGSTPPPHHGASF